MSPSALENALRTERKSGQDVRPPRESPDVAIGQLPGNVPGL